MNHQTRRGPPPVECPLASLGRNTPALDTQSYHHPLSSSPLNPQVYQMSRKSPNLSIDETDDIIYNSKATTPATSACHRAIIDNERHHDTTDIYHLSRSSSSSIDQSSFNVRRNSDNPNNSSNNNHSTTTVIITPSTNVQHPTVTSTSANILAQRQRHHRLPPTTRNYTPIDSLLKYQERPTNSSSSSSYLFENIQNNNDEDSSDTGDGGERGVGHRCNVNVNDTSNMMLVNHHDQYFLEEKMDSLYIQGAIRSLPLGSETNHYKSDRYYLEESLNNICNFNNGSDRLHENVTNHILHRPSSPSETSGSDRYLIDRTRGSPAFINNNNNTNNNNNNDNKLRNNYVNSNTGLDKRFHHSQKIQCFTSDGLSNLGRFSPSFDQGYATLVSPSPSGHQIPGPWSKKELSSSSSSSSCRFNSNFDRLPDECVLKIFNWFDSCELCNVARVCRRFESLAWKTSLWRVITIRGEHINGDKSLKMIFRRLCGQSRNGACPDVERVLLSDGCRLSDKGLQLLSRRCPELTHLQIQSSINVSNQALCDVLTKCTNLQHLDITGCAQITSINAHPSLEPSRRLLLQYLDLTDCSSIDDIGLKVVVRNCPQLAFLYLRRCIQITDAGLKFVPSFCVALKELSVSDCINITDFGLYELAKLGAALRYLSVAKCDRVSDAGLKVIARRCYKLRYLNARGCEAVSDDSITILARSCPRLRALDIGKCDVSDAGLRALAESCPNLKKLSLRNCDMITDRGVQCIAYYCRGLQQLNIQDCPISIEGYRAVKKYCKRCIIEHTNPGFC